jgi:pantoate--beta-alanine ligase
MKEVARQARGRGLRVGLVPTMGYLHEGHLSLIRRVDELADLVIVSVFVNPAQFGPEEDFERYPRDLARDADLCIKEGVDYLFAPEGEEIYTPGPRTLVEVTGISERLEGENRPGHFRGVTTVVLKLFEITRPHIAAFGQKDAQQSIIIERMVHDLMLDVEILVLPTIRETDGVAMSSRNRYLGHVEREAARAIPRALEAARRSVAEGRTGVEDVVGVVRAEFDAESLIRIEYVELVDKRTLAPVTAVEGEALLLLAVRCGVTRLIDNTVLQVDGGDAG